VNNYEIIPYYVTTYGRFKEYKQPNDINRIVPNEGMSLFIVLKGRGEYCLRERYFPIEKGDVFVLTQKDIDSYRNIQGCEFYQLSFRPESIQKIWGSFRELEGYKALFVYHPYFNVFEYETELIHLEESEMKRIIELIENIKNELQEKETGYEQIVNSSFLVLITLLSRSYIGSANKINHKAMPLIPAVAYMQAHYVEKITLRELADMVNFSTRHFNRLFQETYRMTPSQYLLRLRIERACKLLEEKIEMSVTDIAYECGFNDSNYFARVFRNEYGIAPTAYRDNIAPGILT
jgi:AraC family L-rhamnose operon regulatory protein RhaS